MDFGRFTPALNLFRTGANRGNQAFEEQPVKIVWKEGTQNFGGGSHLGVETLIPPSLSNVSPYQYVLNTHFQ